MAKVHGKGTVLKLDDLSGAVVDISSSAVSTKYGPKQDKPVTTTFGARGVRREVIGLGDGDMIPVSAFFQRTAGTKVHGKSAGIYADEFDLSAFFKSLNISNSIALDDTHTFGDLFKERDVPGLFESSADFSGFYDPAAGGSWVRARTHLAGGAAIVTVVPEGAGTAGQVGALVELGKGQFSMTDVSLEVDKVIPLTAKCEQDDAWDLGVLLHANTPETGAVNTTGVDETAATAAGGVAHLHVTAWTGTTAVLKVQDSVDNSAWTDLITFTTVTGLVKERIELGAAAAVKRYVRAQIFSATITSMTFVMAFARRAYTYGAAGTYRHFRGLMGQATSATFQLGPSGSTTGFERITGESRMRSLQLTVDAEQVIKADGELIVTGAPTYDTWP
jgi:hypothetical protein